MSDTPEHRHAALAGQAGALVVEARGVSKTFSSPGRWPWSRPRQVSALVDVDLRVAMGEVVALVGRSGSGKTTLARSILGLTEPDAGTVWLEGSPWSRTSETQRASRRNRYQYVPQDAMAALDPQQTPREAIAETFRVLGGVEVHDARDRASALLSRLGLEERLDALPRDLSGGELRRVTLARVLALRPRLIVADEPTSGLDPDRREEVLEALIGNLPDGAGCILVTHDMAAAHRWAHRALVMLAGRVVEDVDLRHETPRHPYARLLFDPWSEPRVDMDLDDLARRGCPYHSACPRIDDVISTRCRTAPPPLASFDGRDSHRVACYQEEL